MKKKAIILDWAGTAIDFGSNAPVAAFIKAFEAHGITPTLEETRAPMGMIKRAHIEVMLQGERLGNLWKDLYGKAYTQEDIDSIYAAFEPALTATLSDYTTPIEGVLETVEKIRDMGICIGSTTGYTSEMMEIVAPAANAQGYAPDFLVCPDEVGGIGRPYPYMLWRNLEEFGVSSIQEVVKIGDTAADMLEGKNAGCLSVGIIKGSNMLGLTEAEFNELSPEERVISYEATRQKYVNAGADYVLEDMTQLPELLAVLNGEAN